MEDDDEEKEPSYRPHQYNHTEDDILAQLLTGSLPSGWKGTTQFTYKQLTFFEQSLECCSLPASIRVIFRHLLCMSDMDYIHFVLFMLLAIDSPARNAIVSHIPPTHWKIFSPELLARSLTMFKAVVESPDDFNLFEWVQDLRHFYLCLA